MERKLIVHKSEIVGGIVCFLYMLPSSMYKVNGIVMIQDAVSYICFACFFYNLLRRKKYSSIFWLITFAWVSVGISTVLSGNTNLIASYSKKVIKGVAFISFIDYFLRKKELGFLKVIYTILEIEIIINCITIFLFPNGMYMNGSYATNYFMGYHNSHIRWELPALCIKMCYDKLTRKSKTFSINFYCLFIVVAISAVRVLSVTSLLVVGILGIYILIDQNAFFQGVLKRIKFTPLSAVIVSVVGTIIVVGGTIASDQIALLQSLTRYFSKGSTINGRGPIWLSALRRITQHLWLGCGYETYDMTSLNLVGTTGWGTSAHNFCLELLYTGGIVLAVTIALIYLVLYYNSNNWKYHWYLVDIDFYNGYC